MTDTHRTPPFVRARSAVLGMSLVAVLATTTGCQTLDPYTREEKVSNTTKGPSQSET